MSDIDVEKIRVKLGLTQEELAKKLGVSPRTVQNWEAGKTIPGSKHEMLRNLSVLKESTYYGGADDSNIQQKTVMGHNISGNGNNVNSETEKFLELLKKKDEQMDRLISVIEKLSNK